MQKSLAAHSRNQLIQMVENLCRKNYVIMHLLRGCVRAAAAAKTPTTRYSVDVHLLSNQNVHKMSHVCRCNPRRDPTMIGTNGDDSHNGRWTLTEQLSRRICINSLWDQCMLRNARNISEKKLVSSRTPRDVPWKTERRKKRVLNSALIFLFWIYNNSMNFILFSSLISLECMQEQKKIKMMIKIAKWSSFVFSSYYVPQLKYLGLWTGTGHQAVWSSYLNTVGRRRFILRTLNRMKLHSIQFSAQKKKKYRSS